jgi:CBS domain-containing protein
MKVKDVMTKDVITFDPAESIYNAARILRENRISGAPVVSDGRVVGILSETDIMKLVETPYLELNTILPSPFDIVELPIRMKFELKEAMKKIKKASSLQVKEIMTKKVFTIEPEASIEDAAKLMSRQKINRLPVVDKDGKLVGIVTRGDIIGAI